MPSIKSTKSIALNNGVKVLVYGASGAGKTTLAGTVEKPLVLATEKGLLTLQSKDIDFIEINNFQELKETVQMLPQVIQENGYKTLILDSASELCDLILVEEKSKNTNQLKAYGQMNDLMTQVIRTFVNMPIDVVFIAKIEKVTNAETGEQKFCAAAPGSKISSYLPYFFDEVFALRTQGTKDEKGNIVIQRGLQTADDGIYNCKDRSARLAFMERADLGAIFKKIKGEN